MKKITIAFVAVLGLLLTGCSSHQSNKAKPTEAVKVVNQAQKAAKKLKSGNVVLVTKNTQNNKTNTEKSRPNFI